MLVIFIGECSYRLRQIPLCLVGRTRQVVGILGILTSFRVRTMMFDMRTMLTIEDDIADYLREQSRLHEKPLKQVVNETLRRGMSPASNDTPSKPFEVKPFPGGFMPGVDPKNPKDFLNQLDDEHYLEVLRRQ